MARIGSVRAGWLVAIVALGIAVAASAQVPKPKDAKGVPPKDVKAATKDAKSTAPAGEPFRSTVPIQSIDGVDLVGTYYRGTKGKDSPCAIILHRFGSDRSKGDWDVLVRQLRTRGFAVLMFDFRGHGESKAVGPNFYKLGLNRDLITSSRDKTRVESKDLKSAYTPWLVNDILAARKFLEVKNDSGELNIGSLFIIGAQEGASLGLLFAASEWNRTYTTGFKALQSVGTKHVAGEDIAGCVWLSLAQRANNANFELNTWLKNPPLRDRTPMLWVYGERDAQAKRTADQALNTLTGGKDKNKFTQKLEVKGTDLAGQALLGQASLGVTDKIGEFVDKVLDARRAIPWHTVASDENPLNPVPLRTFGFSRLP